MIDSQDAIVKLLQLLSTRFKRLTSDQVEQILDGRADLAYFPAGATVSYPPFDLTEVTSNLAAALDRRAGREYIVGLKLNKTNLQSLAKQLQVEFKSSDRVDMILDRLIERTVGSRIDGAEVRARTWAG